MGRSRQGGARIAAGLLLPLLIASTVLAADELPALRLVREANDAVLMLHADGALTEPARRERAAAVLDGSTAWAVMAEGVAEALGPEAPPEQRRELAGVFQRLLRSRALRSVGRYRVDRVEYRGAEADGAAWLVRTVAHHQGEAVPLDYRVEPVEGALRITGTVLDGVDTVGSYRRQVRSLLRREGYPELIRRLERRIRELEGDPAPPAPPGPPGAGG